MAARFKVLRALVPPDDLPVYRPREHMKGMDLMVMEQARAELVRQGAREGG